MSTAKKVVVMGGGVAGLTAAHELQERGFRVWVYERNEHLGGKARSFPVPSNCKNETIRKLPAEHGFRFFPGFYKHLTDTLSRIPSPEPGNENRHVLHNLVEVERAAFARDGKPFFYFPTHLPRTFGECVGAMTTIFRDPELGIPPTEAAFAAFQLVKAMTMCHERREEELDGQAWWNYMRADDMSPQYRSVIVNGLTQNFVAMDAEYSSTKSVINILARLVNDFIGGTMDRILNGPTSEVWIDHWERYLEAKRPGQWPVVFNMKRQVHSLAFDEASSRITGIRLEPIVSPRKEPVEANDLRPTQGAKRRQSKVMREAIRGREENPAAGDSQGAPIGEEETIETDADYFIAAVPIEAMLEILNNSSGQIKVHAPSLANLDSNLLMINWMSGIVFYLREDVDPLEHAGHVVYLDSEWALTSISQNQFWTPKAKYNPLSVIVSDWVTASSKINKTAKQTDNEKELTDEILRQIRKNLVGKALDAENIVGFWLDPALEYKQGRATTVPNAEYDMRGIMPAVEFARHKASWIEGRRVRRPGVEIVNSDLTTAKGRTEVADPTPDQFIDRNLEPLFINTIKSWQLRPNAPTEIPNLFLASDYVKTNTDLATMEGANEAARRAVNGILDDLESKQRRCRIFEFDEPGIFAPFRGIDKWMYDRGFPHPGFLTKGLVGVRRVVRAFSDFMRTSVFARLSKVAEPTKGRPNSDKPNSGK